MKQQFWWVSLAMVTLILVGCGQEKVAQTRSVPYEVMTIASVYGDCNDLAEGCYLNAISYPVFTKAENSALVDAANRQVKQFIRGYYGEELAGMNLDLETFLADFTNDYDKVRQLIQNARGASYLDLDIAVQANLEKLFCLRCRYKSYGGGNHVSQSQRFVTIDCRSGEQINLEDVFVDGFRPRLSTIVEEELRRSKNLGSAADLRGAGYDFAPGRLPLSEEIGFGKDSLIVHYGAYEIAAGYVGTTVVKVSYRRLSRLIRRDGPLASFAD